MTFSYVTRAEWGARHPKEDPTPLHKPTAGMAVHYSEEAAASDHAECDNQVRGIQNYHMDSCGWNDIAYSWLVCIHGVIYEGRGWGHRTAAQGTTEGNDQYHAVCYLDNDSPNRVDLSEKAKACIADVIAECGHLGWGSHVEPHSYFHPTGCPGQELRAWVQDKGYLSPHAPTDDPTPHPGPVPPKPKPSPSVVTPSWYHRELAVHSPMLTGDDVKAVQQLVSAKVDGIYGPDTASRVRGYQATHNLTVDGVVGPHTAHALGERHTAGQIPDWYKRLLKFESPMLRGSDVKVVQTKLRFQRKNRDGIFGPNTAAAVRRFQSAHRLTVDGIVGPQTAKEFGE